MAMPESPSKLLQSAPALESNTRAKTPEPAKFQRICVCGHPEPQHSPVIGGSWPRARWQVMRNRIDVVRLKGCRGEPRPRGSGEDPEYGIREENPEDPDLPLMVMQYRTTCPCPEFRPVIEVFDPRNRFGQKRPTVGRTKQRDLDPWRHALMVGLKAQKTHVSNFKEIEKMRKDGVRESVIDDRITELYDERFRYLDTWQCMTDGCDETEGVFPYYVGHDDLSELRCQEHRV